MLVLMISMVSAYTIDCSSPSGYCDETELQTPFDEVETDINNVYLNFNYLQNFTDKNTQTINANSALWSKDEIGGLGLTKFSRWLFGDKDYIADHRDTAFDDRFNYLFDSRKDEMLSQLQKENDYLHGELALIKNLSGLDYDSADVAEYAMMQRSRRLGKAVPFGPKRCLPTGCR